MIETPRRSASKQPTHDKLMAAIGILQCHHLATETTLDADVLYGIHEMSSEGLEHAIHLLVDVLGEVEKLEAV